ncbi:hypothetical protein [Nonomuraea sp. NPDC049624]|uniref:hypothetical protein n=1 Tax=Nonomuraea sp. NPDC049624 TaxID=3154354 RepID=UPI0034272717
MSSKRPSRIDSSNSEEPGLLRDLDGLELLKRVYDWVSADLQRMTDLDAAYEIATRLADGMRRLADDAALARAKSAAKISDAENLSRKMLANRLGISKARADQLIRSARNSASP